jgi:hypothetical protein
MHLVLINQYYPPDEAPTGLMLEAVAEQLVADGHEVTVICAAGGYAGGRIVDEEMKMGQDALPGLRPCVLRLRASRFGRGSFLGKLADYASYYLGVAGALARLQPRPDRVVALTTPPYLSVLARAISKYRGADHAHWVMDLYPDVMVAHGMLAQGGGAHRVLAALGRWGMGGKRCAALLTLGPDMASRVGALAGTRQGTGTQAGVDWVPLWANTDSGTAEQSATPAGGDSGTAAEQAARELRRRRGWAEDEVVVMYSGNMGLGHRFHEILEAARGLTSLAPDGGHRRPRYRFVFHGRGKRRGEIEAFIHANPGLSVELHDYAPAAELAAHLRSADVHLASIESSWTGTLLPSKAQGVFAAGRPLLVVGDADSSLARWVEESGGGWVVAPGDDRAMLAALGEAAHAETRIKRGEAARDYSDRHFSRPANVSRCAAILARPRPAAF